MLPTLFRRQPVYTALGVLLLLTLPVFAALELWDGREVDGVGVWVKPLKFSLSLAVYLLTLALFVPFMRQGAVGGLRFKLLVGVVALAVVYESLWLWAASILGIRSHYNIEHPVFLWLYPVAGFFALALSLGALGQGISTLRARTRSPNRALHEAVGLGLVLTFVLTAIPAMPLSQWAGQFGGSPNGYGEGLFGWRMEGGDLRAAHFFGTHAMQAIPLAGLLLMRGPFAVAGVRVFSLLYAVFVLTLAWQSLQRQDLPEVFRIPV